MSETDINTTFETGPNGTVHIKVMHGLHVVWSTEIPNATAGVLANALLASAKDSWSEHVNEHGTQEEVLPEKIVSLLPNAWEVIPFRRYNHLSILFHFGTAHIGLDLPLDDARRLAESLVLLSDRSGTH